MAQDELSDFMRQMIAANNLPGDTCFVFRALNSVVAKEFVDDVVKRHVAAHPKAVVVTGRMEIVPPDQIWDTSLMVETVDVFRYIPDSELH